MLNALTTGSLRRPTRSRLGDVYPSPNEAPAGTFYLFEDARGIGGDLNRLPRRFLQSTGDQSRDS